MEPGDAGAGGVVSTAPDRVVLDMDSSESPVHGEQEGSAYNGTSSRLLPPTVCVQIVTGTA